MNNASWFDELGLAPGDPQTSDEITLRLLDAAYELFLSFGLRRTTIEDIAKRAGVGRPTLYRRFADKEALVQAVVMREVRRGLQGTWKQVAELDAPEEVLVQGFVYATHMAGRHPLIKRLLETEPEFILPYLTLRAGEVIELGQRLLAPPLRAYQERGYFPGIDAAYVVEVAVRLFMSVVLTSSPLVSAAEPAQLERLVRDFFLPLLTRQCAS